MTQQHRATRFGLAGLVLAGSLAALAPTPANATLVININGTNEPGSDPTNTFTSFNGSVGSFNINNITATGVAAIGGSGTLLDVGSLNVNSTGAGSLTIKVTETNLSLAGAAATFTSLFSGTLTNVTATRTFFLDPTNAGLETIALGSTTSGGGGGSFLENLSGPFSLTEQIDVTATGAGAFLSSDDKVSVPEPASLALLGSALLGLGLIRRRRRG